MNRLLRWWRRLWYRCEECGSAHVVEFPDGYYCLACSANYSVYDLAGDLDQMAHDMEYSGDD